MKDKKRLFTILWIIFVVVVVLILLGVQMWLKYDMKRMEAEHEKFKQLVVETKSGEKVDLTFYNFEDGMFFLKIPTSFGPMHASLIPVKYPNGNLPKYVYTNDDAKINIALNVVDTKMSEEDIPTYLEEMKRTLKSICEILSSRTFKKENMKMGEIQFLSPAVDTTIYNHMVFFVQDKKLVIASFNVTEDLKEEWQGVGEFLIDSLTFKKDK